MQKQRDGKKKKEMKKTRSSKDIEICKMIREKMRKKKSSENTILRWRKEDLKKEKEE